MKRFRLSKRYISAFSALIAAAIFGLQYLGVFSNKPIAPAGPGTYKIAHFVDGDTITVSMNGKNETVRFIGVDTPETHRPNTPVQCYGPAAAAFTKQQIGTSNVRLEADPETTNRDRYNRLLRYVYLSDGTLLNQRIIEQGYGFAYTQFPFSKSASFTQAQNQARQQAKGLWVNCHPYQQSNGRWQTENAGAS